MTPLSHTLCTLPLWIYSSFSLLLHLFFFLLLLLFLLRRLDRMAPGCRAHEFHQCENISILFIVWTMTSQSTMTTTMKTTTIEWLPFWWWWWSWGGGSLWWWCSPSAHISWNYSKLIFFIIYHSWLAVKLVGSFRTCIFNRLSATGLWQKNEWKTKAMNELMNERWMFHGWRKTSNKLRIKISRNHREKKRKERKKLSTYSKIKRSTSSAAWVMVERGRGLGARGQGGNANTIFPGT